MKIKMSALKEVDLEAPSVYASLDDRYEVAPRTILSIWTWNQFLQKSCRSWPFPCCSRGIYHINCTLLPNSELREPTFDSGYLGGVFATQTNSQANIS